MIQYSQMTRKWKNTPHSVRHLYALHYHFTQKYFIQEYILGSRQQILTINMNSIQENVAYGSCILEAVYFTISYVLVTDTRYLCIITDIYYI